MVKLNTELSLYRFANSERTVRITHELAARFGGMTLVVEDAGTPTPSPTKAATRAKTTNSSKEAK